MNVRGRKLRMENFFIEERSIDDQSNVALISSIIPSEPFDLNNLLILIARYSKLSDNDLKVFKYFINKVIIETA